MVFAALAQSYAFTYKEYLDTKRKKNSMFRTIGQVLNMKDVIHDANNTFIKHKLKDEEEAMKKEWERLNSKGAEVLLEQELISFNKINITNVDY